MSDETAPDREPLERRVEWIKMLLKLGDQPELAAAALSDADAVRAVEAIREITGYRREDLDGVLQTPIEVFTLARRNRLRRELAELEAHLGR